MPIDDPDLVSTNEGIRTEEMAVAIVLLLAGLVGVGTTLAHGAVSGSAGGLGVVFLIAGGFALRVAIRRRRR